jgi:FKBP-type peptidyl-prolyl cis-trans isomerase
MNYLMRFKWLVLILVVLTAVAVMAQDERSLTTDREKVSYGIGLDAGKALQQRDLDLDYLIKGLRDGFSGNDPLMSEEELQTALQTFIMKQEQKQMEAARVEGEKNQREGEQFLSENSTKEGVVTLESGLQYKILKAGEGRKPTADDSIKVHYRGKLIDGTEFDSSYQRGETAVFPVSQIIAGLKEGLQLMPVGSRWELFIPAQLGYGLQSVGDIGPNSTLIFEIELLSIE